MSAVLFALPLALVAVCCVLAAAGLLWEGGAAAWWMVRLARWVLVALACVTIACVLLDWPRYRDWMHLYWSVQYPLLGLFAGSGALLCTTWRRDRRAEAAESGRAKLPWCGAWVFVVLVGVCAVMPIALRTRWPEYRPPARATGQPVRGLVEIAAFGLGGAEADALAVRTLWDEARGMGFLPRELTVPLGSTMLGALILGAFALLALALRLVPGARTRRSAALLAPFAILGLAFAMGGGLESRLWTTDPALMRAYGPTLAAAGALLGVLAVALWVDRRRAAGEVARSQTPLPREAVQ